MRSDKELTGKNVQIVEKLYATKHTKFTKQTRTIFCAG